MVIKEYHDFVKVYLRNRLKLFSCYIKIKKIVFILICFSSISLYAYELRLHFVKTFIRSDKVAVDVRINEAIPLEVQDYISQGIVVVLNYRIEMVKQSFIIDDVVHSIYFQRRIYYDFFNKEYVLSFENGRESRNKSLGALLRILYNITTLDVVESSELNENDKYYYRTRLSMRFINAYPYLSIFFNLITPLRYRIKWMDSVKFTKSQIEIR